VADDAGWHLPSTLSRAVAFTDGSGVVIAGGLRGDQTTTSTVVRVDLSTGAVTPAGSLAEATHDAAGGVINQRQVVFGGGAQRVSDTVQQLQPNGPSTIIGHLPQPRADLTAVTIGSTVYLVGGYDGSNATRDVLATTDGRTFRTVAVLSTGVRYPAVAAVGNTIYVFGGEWAGTESSTLQAIDVAHGSVRVLGRLPSPRSQAAATVLGNTIYVAGGRVHGATSADILSFDASTTRFTLVGELPWPVADAALGVAADRAYLVGGEAESVLSSAVRLQRTTTPVQTSLAERQKRPFGGRLLIADRGNNRLIVIDAAKRVSWVYPSAAMPPPAGGFYFPDDGFFVDHGRSIIANEEENNTIVRIGFPSGAIQWSYGQPRVPGSTPGLLNQPDDAFLLRDGTVVVADAKNCRILHLSAQAKPLSQIGTTGRCVHDPPSGIGYPNGDTPLANGNLLVSEINGSWISEYTLTGSLVWTVHLPIAYPSDPQQLGPDLYLAADYAKPGGIVEFTREGQIVWTYRPTSGNGMLDHPSLADRLPNGLIAVNDDYRHRVAFIDPATKTIVWQYGQTDRPGTGPDQLNIPDGFDLLLSDNSTPLHLPTG